MNAVKVAVRIVVTVAVVLVSAACFGQTQPNLENGFKPYGSYDGTHLDTVNLMNGNLILHLPLVPDHPQRGGLAQHYNLYVSSKDWQVKCVPDDVAGQVCYWISGGTGVNPQTSLGMTLRRTVDISVIGSGQGSPVITAYGYGLISADAASHPLVSLQSTSMGGDATRFEAADTSGYHLELSNPDSEGVPSSFTVTDRQGNLYSGQFIDSSVVQCGKFPTSQIPSVGPYAPMIDDAPMGDQYCSQTAMAQQVSDSNGNLYMFDGSFVGIPYTPGADTLGRVPPLVSGALTTDYSDCASPYPILQAALYYYTAPDGTTQAAKFCYSSFPILTAFSQAGVVQAQDNPDPRYHQQVKVTTAILADGSKWTFNYDNYGELTYVGLPTGGSISYTWMEIAFLRCDSSDPTQVSRAVATRTLDDGRGHSSTWIYNWGPVNGASIRTVVTDPLSNDAAHTFTALDFGQTGFPGCRFYETSTQYYDGVQSASHLLKQVDTTYAPFVALGVDDDGSGQPGSWPSNIVPSDVLTTIYPSGKVSKVHRDYDAGLGPNQPIFGNVVRELVYDWGQGAPGPLLRETDTTYQWQADTTGAYLAAHLLDLPASVTVKDGSGCALAVTEYSYDESAYLTAANISTQHTAPPYGVRGNLTTVTHWLAGAGSCNPKGGAAVASHTNWYDTGEAYQQIDPLGHTATHSYDAFYKGAYSTETCNALNQCVSGTYDFNTGVLTSFTNANATTYSSGNTPGDAAHTGNYAYDFMWRLTSAQAPPDPDNNSLRATTGFTFSAPNVFPMTVQRQKSITTTLSDVATSTFDGLGRMYKTQHATPDGNVTIDTKFDGIGRVASVTNPYFATTDPTYGVTQTAYDALDRATQVTRQDGGISAVDYSAGNCTLSTDEAGKQRRSCSDALGRLVEVNEPNPDAAATAATGSMVISGSEQPALQSGAPGRGSVTISGAESATAICTTTCHILWDAGTVSITVGVYPTKSVSFSSTTNTTAAAVAYALSCAFHNDSSSPVDAPCPVTQGTSTTVDLTARTTGLATNYPLSVSATTKIDPPSYTITAPASLTGALNSSASADTGSVTVTVNGTGYSTTYGASDTAATIAARLAATISAGTSANATSTGGTVNVTTKDTGGGTNYSLSASYTYNSANFVGPSFTTSVSGSALAGGYDASAIGNNPYVTVYSYDALGNLLRVDQKGSAPTDSTQWRTRLFTYDSLSRLLTANNPESGQISYQYDLDGNLLQKTSPAPNQTGTATQTISYCYDALHRVTGKAYSEQTCQSGLLPAGTAVVSYVYDQGVNGIGHLSSLTDQAGTATYSYDILGRLSREQRTLPGSTAPVSKTVSYDYNLDGSLKALHYPSGAVVTYTPDSAGRTVSAVDIDNAINYVTGATYGPDNALTGSVRGATGGLFSGISIGSSYNKRLQPVGISVVYSASPTSFLQLVFSIGYDFHLGAGDNGNVYGITNDKDPARNQTFTYDVLNRLTSAQNAGTDCNVYLVDGHTKFWGNSYGYDAWGNLLQKVPGKCTAEGLSVLADAKNQIHTGDSTSPDYTYDAAGNMTSDVTDGVTASYDAENRISTATRNGVTTTYVYDADGNRVEKTNGTSSTLYWYMTPGIVAESDLAGTLRSEYVFFGGERVARRDLTSPAGVFYYFSDHLKTASVITDSAGNIKAESDYYPWGGELQFVNADSNHYKFTGKERDAESDLDYFGARYYSNGLGRFFTPDWAAHPIAVPYVNFGNPQSLNLYTYGKNNPTTFGDPDGHCVWDLCIGEGAATYVAVGVLAAGTAAYLASPSGQQALKAGGHLISTAVGAVSGLFHRSHDSKTTPVPQSNPAPGTQTKTDNPARPGTLGKPDHQETVKQEADRINGKTEVPIPIPGGLKDSRRADVVGTNPETGQPEVVQVYRPTPAGNIPKREIDAANDIETATGIRPTMVPVRPLPKKEEPK